MVIVAVGVGESDDGGSGSSGSGDGGSGSGESGDGGSGLLLMAKLVVMALASGSNTRHSIGDNVNSGGGQFGCCDGGDSSSTCSRACSGRDHDTVA